MKVFVSLIAGVWFCLMASGSIAATRPDIVVYGDRSPATKRNGQPFVAPFNTCEYCYSDPAIVADYEVIPGMSAPLGANVFRTFGWGKYLFLGNFEPGSRGFGGLISSQQVGIFDTERKTFCSVDVSPGADAPIETLAVASPKARQSRIYFQGFGASGSAFGWLEGDLDKDDPCNPDPNIGWRVVKYSAAGLNALAAAGVSPPCPGAFCGFDGLAVISHMPNALGRDILTINNWWTSSVISLRVDSAGGVEVFDNHPVNVWQPAGAGQGGACFELRPVTSSLVDRNRTCDENGCDLRFTTSYDITCTRRAGMPSDCAADVPMCPGTGQSCVVGVDTCPKSYCSNTLSACNPLNPDCGLGACINTCALVHPGSRCSATGQVCAQDADCPPPTVITEWPQRCICGPARPFQEFGFNPVTQKLRETSAFVLPGSGAFSGARGDYDSNGALWVEKVPLVGPARPLGYYPRSADGEHDYYKLTNPAGTEIWPIGSIFDYRHADEVAFTFGQLQVGNSMYFIGNASVQRATYSSGSWAQDSAYKIALGNETLPAEGRSCSGGPRDKKPCAVNEDCPNGTSNGLCQLSTTFDPSPAHYSMSVVGSPPALMVAASFTDLERRYRVNTYVKRVPIPVPVDDSVSMVRPGIAWTSSATCASSSCNRLWMVAERDGVLKYRVRDDGLWTSWFPLPANPVTLGGGASLVFFNGGLEVYSRSSAGVVISTTLTAPIDCKPSDVLPPPTGACTWAPWTSIPGSPITDREPAVAVYGTTGPMVGIRRASDGRLMFAQRTSGTWSSWQLASPSVVTNEPPALAYLPSDARMWMIVKRANNGRLSRIRIEGLNSSAWVDLPVSGQEPWGPGPQIINDGTRIRVFAARGASPLSVYQITATGHLSWDQWGAVFSGAQSTYQPAVAVVNGDVDLVTAVLNVGMEDNLVR